MPCPPTDDSARVDHLRGENIGSSQPMRVVLLGVNLVKANDLTKATD